MDENHLCYMRSHKTYASTLIKDSEEDNDDDDDVLIGESENKSTCKDNFIFYEF